MSDGIYELGQVNGHLIGTVMKSWMVRAISIIQREFFRARVDVKQADDGRLTDVVTAADLEVQAMYFRAITESLPLFGVVAEEGKARKACLFPGHEIWFTVDAIDGTRAFIRRASHGIGTMIALVYDGEVIAAYVGDVTTQEIYGYRPDSNRVHRSSFNAHVEDLSAEPPVEALREQIVLLRDPSTSYTPLLQHFINPGRVFRSQEITRGSIGLTMARLWQREVGAVVLCPGPQKPWDCVPFVGISRKLGFAFLRVDTAASRLVPFDFPVCSETVVLEHETLIVHSGHVQELLAASAC